MTPQNETVAIWIYYMHDTPFQLFLYMTVDNLSHGGLQPWKRVRFLGGSIVLNDEGSW